MNTPQQLEIDQLFPRLYKVARSNVIRISYLETLEVWIAGFSEPIFVNGKPVTGKSNDSAVHALLDLNLQLHLNEIE